MFAATKNHIATNQRPLSTNHMAEPSSTAATIATADPPVPATKSWADEADEETNASTAEAETSSVNLEALTIDDKEKNSSKLLDDPDDSNIQAVRFARNTTLSLCFIII